MSNKNILDNMIDNNIIDNTLIKQSKKKKDIYKNERNQLIEKIFIILKIKENNNILFYNDISKIQIDEILKLLPDIKKYFKTNIYNKNENIENDIIKLLKSLFKDEDYTLAKITIYLNKINKVGYLITKNKLFT